MASSSSQRGAPPDQLAAFYKLVDKAVIAGTLCRYARAAELSASAAVKAEALYGENSLVVANLRMCESSSFTSVAEEAGGTEDEALVRRAAAVLLSLIALLLRRLEANALLPGTIREEELDYFAHLQSTLKKAMNKPVPPPAVLRAVASTMGYDTFLSAMYRSLDLLAHPLWPDAQKKMVE